MTTVLYLTKDLLFQSRVASLAKALDLRLVVDRKVPGLLDKISDQETSCVRLILVDLTCELDLTDGLVPLRQRFPAAQYLAYGPHVQEDRLEAAVQAGFDQVLTRGQFDRQMQAILEPLASSDG